MGADPFPYVQVQADWLEQMCSSLYLLKCTCPCARPPRQYVMVQAHGLEIKARALEPARMNGISMRWKQICTHIHGIDSCTILLSCAWSSSIERRRECSWTWKQQYEHGCWQTRMWPEPFSCSRTFAYMHWYTCVGTALVVSDLCNVSIVVYVLGIAMRRSLFL